jgi:hypothetical protein
MTRRSSFDAVIDDCLREMEGELEFETYAEKTLKHAVLSNRRYKVSLGWNTFEQKIAEKLLGYTNSSPTEEAFAKAVARWQVDHNIWPSDGMLGPDTWPHMRSALGIAP